MSSSEKVLVQESLREFTDGLQSLVPLRHFSEYHEEARITIAAQEESNKVLNNFIRKTEAYNDLRVKGDLLKELCLELEKVIEEHLRKNQQFKAEAKSFLKKRSENLSEDFKGTYKAKLLLSPDMDLKSCEELLENGKMLALCYFENHSNHGNAELYEEQKRKLEENLDHLRKDMLEKQRRRLEDREKEKAIKSLQAVEEIVSNMPEQIQCDIDTLQELLSKQQKHIDIIYDYLARRRNASSETAPRNFSELSETLDGAMNYLNEAKDDMYLSLENGVGWAKRLELQLKSYMREIEKAERGQDMKLQRNGNEIALMKSVSAETTCILGTGEEPKTMETALAAVEPNESFAPELPKDMVESISSWDVESDLNICDDEGFAPLHRAIVEKSVEEIEALLNAGANPNIKTITHHEATAAHVVISGLIHRILTRPKALSILNLLVAKGFNLLNDGSRGGWTPILYATQFEDLDEELLTWFFKNGADFNALTDESKDSVLLQAIWRRHNVKIIRKIIDFRANPKYTNRCKENALHISARVAHESALKLLLNYVDVNSVSTQENTPLHLLLLKDLDYEPCLKILLDMGADFGAKNAKGLVPLAEWMRRGEVNPFPTLMKLKDILPITEGIASDTLTAFVQHVESIQKFSPLGSGRTPSQELPNELVKFITFLIEEKKGKLRLKNGRLWKSGIQRKLEDIFLTEEFLKTLIASGSKTWQGELIQINTTELGELEFCTKTRSGNVPIEIVLLCLLACKHYLGFFALCKLLKYSPVMRI